MSSRAPLLPQTGVYTAHAPINGFVIVHLIPNYDITKVVKAIANQPFMVGFKNTPIDTEPTQPGVFGKPGIIYFAQMIQGNHNRFLCDTIVAFSYELYSNIFQAVIPPTGFGPFQAWGNKDNRAYIPATGGEIFMQVKTSSGDLANIIIKELLDLLGDQVDLEKTKPVISGVDGMKDYGSPGKNMFGYYDATSRTTCLPSQFNPGFSHPRGYEDFHCLTQNPNMDVGPFMNYVDYANGTTKIHEWGRMGNALIQDDPIHMYGSFVLALQFEYDRLQEFLKMDVDMPLHGTLEQKKNTQDGTFGRKKHGPFAGGPEDIPPNCHTLKNFQPIPDQSPPPNGNTFEQQFIERAIYRQAGEYKEPGDEEKGTGRLFFTAYHYLLDTYNILLGNMTGSRPDINGNSEPDLLFNFVKCHTGQQFYAPNWRELVSMGSLYKDGNPNYVKH